MDNNLHNKVILKHIFMKVSSILVICLIIKLQEWVVFRDIFSLNIKSNILAISVIKKLQHRGVFRGILSPNMKVSSIFSLNTKVLNILVVFVTKNLPVKIIKIHISNQFMRRQSILVSNVINNILVKVI